MPRKLLVVGGGMTGLAAAYLAAKQGASVTVLEAAPSLGGLLQTFEIGGGRLEYFYHHHFRADTEFAWLLRELQLDDKLIFHPTTMGIYRGGKFYGFNGAGDLLKFSPLGLLDKARFVLSSLYLAKYCDWRKYEALTAYDWFRKNAGRAATECIWAPMMQIKFGDWADKIPLAWMIGRLRQRLLSRKGAQEMLGYLDGSLNTLLVGLQAALIKMGVGLVTKAPVTGLVSANGRATAVLTPAGQFTADDILFTTPSDILPDLLRPHDPGSARELAGIEYFGAVCMVVETKAALSQTYWLNVADPGFPFGGVIEHTNLIGPEHFGNRHIAYLSRYFERNNPLATQNPGDIKRQFVSGLLRLYPALKEDDILNVHCHRTMTAAPVCDLNFSRKVPPFALPLKGLYLASMPQLWPDERSCNNSIRLAADALEAAGYQNQVPRGTTTAGLVAREKAASQPVTMQ
jgi:protoporphyrinogen oxidase